MNARTALLIVLLLLVGRTAFFVEPLGISVDESTYLALSERASEGQLYVDAVDRKPPGLFWVYQGIQKIFGDWNIHGVHFVFFLLTLLLCFLAIRITKNSWAGILFAAFSACFPREVFSSNAELVMMIPIAFAFLLITRELEKSRPRVFPFAFATFLAGISTLFKQYGCLIYAPMFCVAMVPFIQKNKWAFVFQNTLYSALALVACYGSVVLYFASQGNLTEFLQWSLFDGLSYISQDAAKLNQQIRIHIVLIGVFISWIPLWLALGSRFSKKNWKTDFTIPLAGLLGALATACLSGRYYTHYFIPAIWFLCVLATPVVQKHFQKFFGFKKIAYASFVFLPFAVFTLINTWREPFFKDLSFTKERQNQIAELGNWVRSRSEQNDRIIVWGMASQIFVTSERGSASRYVFSDFVAGRLPGFRSSVSIPTPGAMEIFLTEIEQNRPLYFIDTSTAKLNDYGAFPPSRFPPLEELLNKNFIRQESVAGFDIWKRR